MRRWLQVFRRQLQSERHRLPLWTPVGLMIGIGLYFGLDNEPPLWSGAFALALSLLPLAALWRRPARIWAMPVVLVALGFAAGQLRAHWVETPLITSELHARMVEGTIDEIEPGEDRDRLILSRLVIEDLPAQDTPARIRISFRAHNPLLMAGDRVRFQGNVFPLPSPSMPGAYDFARHFYFQGIGGVGFAFRAAEKIAQNASGLSLWVKNLRHSIGDTMRAQLPGQGGAVSAAMTVSETGPISSEVQEHLRDSGLSHMLSISGLHLAIVSGIIFFNVRLLLTLMPRVALRIPAKKIAAAAAILCSFIYLALAGFVIPAQRAFIMISFVLTAIIIDRKPLSLRTLSIAASALLLLFPESMLGASFQMSFAATLSIVALYESCSHLLHRRSAGYVGKILSHLFGILITSLVATCATSAFVLYNFNRFALFGLLSNMVVIPLATFTIMPGMALGLAGLPFGLSEPGFWLMGWGTDIMLSMSAWVASLPGASMTFASPTSWGLLLTCFGLLWLCLIAQKIRFLGIACMVLGLSTIALHEPVDVFIARDARQVMVRLDDGRYAALRGTERSFNVKNWLRSEGQEHLVPQKQTPIACDKNICRYASKGHTIILLKNPGGSELAKACAESAAALIAWWYFDPDGCPAPHRLIGRSELEAYGAHALRLRENRVEVTTTHNHDIARRLWQPVLTGDSMMDEL